MFRSDTCLDEGANLCAAVTVDGTIAQAKLQCLIAVLLQSHCLQHMQAIQLTHRHHVLHTPLVPKGHASNLVGQHTRALGAEDRLARLDVEGI